MDGTSARPRLGELLLQKGLVSEEELAEGLRLHEETGRPLGEVFTDVLGVVSLAAVRDLLLLQRTWRPLGEMLLERALLTEAQLLEALDEQERSGRPLGEVVRDLFRISSLTLQKVLRDQRELEVELDRGYTSGLRNALQTRARARSLEPAADGGSRVQAFGLAERIATPVSEAHTHLAVKQIETGAKRIEELSAVVEQQLHELSELRGALTDRQLTIIELEDRVAELEAQLRAPASPRIRSTPD